jgi:IMP cyclohydrolase
MAAIRLETALARMEYPGRFIMLGMDPSADCDVVVYGITGRSTSSQARKISVQDIDENTTVFMVEPTDSKLVEQGNKDLLVYPAIVVDDRIGMVVSNGKQTEDLARTLTQSIGKATYPYVRIDPTNFFGKALQKWEYEPDHPNNTPRISGVVSRYTLFTHGGLSIISKDQKTGSNFALKNVYDYVFPRGEGRLISTYTGENTNPLPSFQGEPLEVFFNSRDHNSLANDIYDALAPKEKAPDFRVSVAVVYYICDKKKAMWAVKNRHDNESY